MPSTRIREMFTSWETEQADVAEWRYDFAISLGYPDDYAVKLGVSQISLHDIEKLLNAGCDPVTAIQILR